MDVLARQAQAAILSLGSIRHHIWGTGRCESQQQAQGEVRRPSALTALGKDLSPGATDTQREQADNPGWFSPSGSVSCWLRNTA